MIPVNVSSNYPETQPFMHNKQSNTQPNKKNDDNNENEATLHPIVQELRDLLDQSQWRLALYLFLIVVSVVPIATDSIDFLDGGDGNEFCGNIYQCGVAVASCIFICIGVGILSIFKIYYWSEHWNKMTKLGAICIGIGCVILVIAIFMVMYSGNTYTICYTDLYQGCKNKDCTIQSDTNCIQFDETCLKQCGESAISWCRWRFLGRNIFCILVMICLITDYMLGKRRYKDDFARLRLICFGLALAISSSLRVITYYFNYTIYKQHVAKSLGIVTYVTCMSGYILVIIATICSSIICLCGSHQRRIGYILSILLLLGVTLVQAKSYNQSSVKFTLMGIVAFADIHVLISSTPSKCCK